MLGGKGYMLGGKVLSFGLLSFNPITREKLTEEIMRELQVIIQSPHTGI